MSACVLDTDVLIGALERRDAHHRRAASLLRSLIANDARLLLSAINYAEALVKPAQDVRTLRFAVDAIRSLGVHVHEPDAAIGEDAARLRRLNISLADGFALATARRVDASLATFDTRVRAAARTSRIPLV